MNIGDVAEASGLPVKTIRYYEDIALVRPARGANGYRAFTETDAHKLKFLSRARSLGFTIEECRTLLSLWSDQARSSADVKQIAERHLDRIVEKIAELQAMQATLKHLVGRCHGDSRPDCPILDNLAGQKGGET